VTYKSSAYNRRGRLRTTEIGDGGRRSGPSWPRGGDERGGQEELVEVLTEGGVEVRRPESAKAGGAWSSTRRRRSGARWMKKAGAVGAARLGDARSGVLWPSVRERRR